MRKIIFDTETTGLSPDNGDKIIEIAAIEMINDLPTEKQFHTLINPQRSIPEDSTRIHGMTDEDVKDKPIFSEIADDFLSFVNGAKLIAHNASFDFKFLNYELKQAGLKPLNYEDNAIDTLLIAKKKFPGTSVSLDALCRRFNIDLSKRDKHNALLDCELLADVYVELLGGRQSDFIFTPEQDTASDQEKSAKSLPFKHVPVKMTLTEEELQQHKEFIEKNIKDPMWLSGPEDENA